MIRQLKSFMKKLKDLFLSALVLCTGSCQVTETVNTSDVIVLFNSNSPEVSKGLEKTIPYLDHFGISFTAVDLVGEPLPSNPEKFVLVLVSHPQLSGNDKTLGKKLNKFLEKCVSSGTGILSFDPRLPSSLLSYSNDESGTDPDVGELTFTEERHYITEYHQAGELQDLFAYISVPKMKTENATALIRGNDLPLLVVNADKPGKIVQWTSQDWMYRSVLGPLGGMDDCLWRSIVWAARKPFTMQALPPIATMRVDDVAGSGRQVWDETPLYWVKTVNKYGFKPWLGLFNYNLSPEAIEELKELVHSGLATASPHAFGRPPRPESSMDYFESYYKDQMVPGHFIPDYYYPDALPYLSDYYDEFIFYDHNNRKPWPDSIANIALAAIDKWYEDVGPLPMSTYFVPHWGELGTNVLSHVADKWNCEFTIIGGNLEKYWSDPSAVSIQHGPFNLFDEPVVGRPKENAKTARASYAADFVELAGERFFFFASAISDITGYELQPDNDVEATAVRGIETLSRGLEGKSLAVLFTHETDYIFKIRPENWDQIFSSISHGISKYNPDYLTMDEALYLVRAFQTSGIRDSHYNAATGKLSMNMSGNTDVPTSCFVYSEEDGKIVERLVEVPVFENEVTVEIALN
jgi:hypothetical protein